MEDISQSDKDQILQLVGAIVITSQTAEALLKSFLPHVELKKQIAGNTAKRVPPLKRRTLGDLAGIFSATLAGDPESLRAITLELARVVESRNQITHHFSENYAKDINAGDSTEVIRSLQDIYSNISAFCSAMQHITSTVLHARDQLKLANSEGEPHIAEVHISFESKVAS